jgi:tRNA dimethylallyltransferase
LETKKNSLIVIVGPTAVGKTAIAIELAKQFGSEIISADSRQIFKEMTIGTAKPSDDELKAISHHFINSHSINEAYDAAQYGRDALALINELFTKHKVLILCGGSGLYIKALLEGFDDIPEVPENIREELNLNFEKGGLVWLQNKMQELDPDHFKTIDQQNPHRLIRALEVRMSTGQSISTFQKKTKLDHDFNVIKIGLEVKRDELYQRIDNRMDKMIETGLFEEAKSLYTYKHHQALQTVGYQEIFDFMDGHYDRDEAIRLLKRNSRRYAKRQLTWFKRDEEIKWFAPDALPAIINWLKGLL